MNQINLISINLKRIISERHLSMNQVERMAGISPNQISKYVREIHFPTCFVLCQIAEALEIDVREFFKPQEEE